MASQVILGIDISDQRVERENGSLDIVNITFTHIIFIRTQSEAFLTYKKVGNGSPGRAVTSQKKLFIREERHGYLVKE